MGWGRKTSFFIHLETQYAKTDCKNEIFTKNWVRKTWTEKKSTLEKSQRSKSTQVNGLVNDDVSWRGRVTSADDVAVMTLPRADVSRWRPGTCRRVERVRFCAKSFGGAWWRVEAPMMVRFPWEGRSSEDDLSGTCKNTIGARSWRWRYGNGLETLNDSGCRSETRDDDWNASKV